jgi:alanine racemase
MALTLHVDTAAWQAMVSRVWNSYDGLIPVVKGNGYGFGRAWLINEASERGATDVAVGTVFEMGDAVALGLRPLVLTPSLDLDSVRMPRSAVLTVGSTPQLDHVLRHVPLGAVMVKVASRVRRHGFAIGEVGATVERVRNAGLDLHSLSIHPPINGSDEERLREIEELLADAPPGVPVSVSHLGPDAYRTLRERHPGRRFSIRLGSALWHGDKASLRLSATVLDIRPVSAGDRAGYRQEPVAGTGHLVIIDAGSAHGVAPLPGGESPFHFGRRRMALVEPPHMHASIAFVADGDPVPAAGDAVDVQRPLISTSVDRTVWHSTTPVSTAPSDRPATL